MYSIILTLTLFKSCVLLYWICLYSEEKLDIMERDLKIETFPTGVKMINYRQYRYPNNTYFSYR